MFNTFLSLDISASNTAQQHIVGIDTTLTGHQPIMNLSALFTLDVGWWSSSPVSVSERGRHVRFDPVHREQAVCEAEQHRHGPSN